MYVTVSQQQTVQDTNFHTSNFQLQLFLAICFLLLLFYTKTLHIEAEKVDICKNNMGCLALFSYSHKIIEMGTPWVNGTART